MDANCTRRVGNEHHAKGTAAFTRDFRWGLTYAVARDCKALPRQQPGTIPGLQSRPALCGEALLRTCGLSQWVDPDYRANRGLVRIFSATRHFSQDLAAISPESRRTDQFRHRGGNVRTNTDSQSQAEANRTEGLDIRRIRESPERGSEVFWIYRAGAGVRRVASRPFDTLLDGSTSQLSSERKTRGHQLCQPHIDTHKKEKRENCHISITSPSHNRHTEDFRSNSATTVFLASQLVMVLRSVETDYHSRWHSLSQGIGEPDVSHQAHGLDVLLGRRSCDCPAAGRSFVTDNGASALWGPADCGGSCQIGGGWVAGARWSFHRLPTAMAWPSAGFPPRRPTHPGI